MYFFNVCKNSAILITFYSILLTFDAVAIDEYKWINVQAVKCIVWLNQAKLPRRSQQWSNRRKSLKNKVGKVHYIAKLDALTASTDHATHLVIPIIWLLP